MADFTRFWKNSKNLPKRKIWVGNARKKGFVVVVVVVVFGGLSLIFNWFIDAWLCRSISSSVKILRSGYVID